MSSCAQSSELEPHHQKPPIAAHEPLTFDQLTLADSTEHIRQIFQTFFERLGRRDSTTSSAADWLSGQPGLRVTKKPEVIDDPIMGKVSQIHVEIYLNSTQKVYETYFSPYAVYREENREYGPNVPLMADMAPIAVACLTPNRVDELGWPKE